MDELLISIGKVSELTGISVYTLRMWERRYGFPLSTKLPSGHRRYDQKEVVRLKTVKEALAIGMKASETVPLSFEKLTQALETHQAKSSQSAGESPLIKLWLNLAVEFNERKLLAEFESEWIALGAVGFVDQRVAPFLKRMGEYWMQGLLSVSQEHLVSQNLETFLANKWTQLNSRAKAGTITLSTLPGESHILGLHLCATVMTAAGYRVVFLGGPTPVDDIVSAARSSKSQFVGLSFSQFAERDEVRIQFKQIQKALPKNIRLLLGGAGAPEGGPLAHRISDLTQLYEWLRTHR